MNNFGFTKPTPKPKFCAWVDWSAFSNVVREHWARPADLERECQLSHATADRVWHGKPIGTAVFLFICRKMLVSPGGFLCVSR